jgi:hypothetical protein
MLISSPSRRRRFAAMASPVLVEALESRTLLSAVHPLVPHGLALGHAKSHGNGLALGHLTSHHPALHVHKNAPITTPIENLTGSPTTISAIAGVGFVADVATLNSSTTPIKLCRGYSVSIDWGDSTVASRGQIRVSRDGTIHVRGRHNYAAAGTFTVTVTITQQGGSTTLTVVSSATVEQNSPTGVTVNPVSTQPFTGTVGTFTIPSTDTNTDPSTFIAFISWGDRQHSRGTVTLNSDGSYSVSGTNTYAAPGTYRIKVFVFQPAVFASPTTTENDSDSDETDGGDGEHSGRCAFSRGGFRTIIYSTAIVS